LSAEVQDGPVQIDPAGERDVSELAEVLVDCVEGGASVGFLAGVDLAAAQAFWRAALPGASTWVARLEPGGPVVGVVQLQPAKLPNGAHRADVAKLLVHRSARGRGVASVLMARLEQEALAQGRWLLLLDTETGSPAQALYERSGWQVVGVVEDHAVQPGGALAPTTFLVKRLR
jgi:GNAT superfamily N-acetyltransferase